MTDVEEAVTISQENEGTACQTIGPSEDQPPLKRRKPSNICSLNHLDLEARLLRVFSCSVCLEIPNNMVYQCQNGHLSCIGCFNHLLADARLKNEQATCPSCRVEISHKTCSRNLAVESAVSELPTECRFCQKEFTRNEVKWHENELCPQRPAVCKYDILGCEWEGTKSLQPGHEDGCDFPFKSGKELMNGIAARNKLQLEECSQLRLLIQMMSCEKISICDIQLSPTRSDDFIPKLFYESNRFMAFDQSWMMKAKVLGNEKSLDRKLAYQLMARNKCSLELKYFIVKGPFGELEIIPELQRFEFLDDKRESAFHPVALRQNSDCNRLLSSKTINVRLLMFMISK